MDGEPPSPWCGWREPDLTRVHTHSMDVTTAWRLPRTSLATRYTSYSVPRVKPVALTEALTLG